MAIIYGKICNLDNKQYQEKFINAEFLYGPGYIEHLFTMRNSSGSVIINPKEQYKPEDFLFEDKESELSIVMVGVIYNLREIKMQNSFGESYNNVPEIMLALYRKYGESFITILNGDFSIIINDYKLNRIFLYRDHLGIKPLAYTKLNNVLYFSSDTFGLCKAMNIDREIYKLFLVQFIQNSDYIEYETMPSLKIRKVLPGHYVVWNSEAFSQKKYWFPEDIRINHQLKPEEIVQKLKIIVTDAVQTRCDKRLKASAHLSAGLDSGLVSVLARNVYKNQEEFYGFSWSPDSLEIKNKYFDERELITELANEYRINPVYCSPNLDNYWQNLSDWRFYSYMFYEHEVLTECKQRGINLLFSGCGGDEFLSMNDRGVLYDLFFGLNWSSLIRKAQSGNASTLLGTFFYAVILPTLRIFYFRKPKDQWSYKYFKYPYNKKPNRNKNLFKVTSRRSVHLRQLYNYHIPRRTETESMLGFRYGVEYRYPLLDKRIIEFILQVPSKVFASFPYPRPIIREIAHGVLPENVRLHLPKEDAIRLTYLNEMFHNTLPLLFSELADYKNNPDLNFIDFQILEEDMIRLKDKSYKYDELDFLILLNGIKQMHEFTKGYRE